MKLGITGATGFIGRRAAELAAAKGWHVTTFTRRPDALAGAPGTEVRLFRTDGPVDVEGLDAVIHLAGEPIFGLWTAEKRRRIMDSRVEGTRALAAGFARASKPPKVLVSGSAIGFYGNTGDMETDETGAAGTGFLADVVRAWETEAQAVRDARVVLLRTGFVVGRGGGAMRVLLPVFRLALGGRLGSGRQWMSCIHVDDVARMALWAVEEDALTGPVNAVLPRPCTNATFTKALARAVRRPAVCHVPAWLLRMLPGGMGSLFLGSSRILPRVALKRGYAYAFRDLPDAFAKAAG